MVAVTRICKPVGAALALGVFCSAARGQMPPAGCLHYEPAVVELRGRVILEKHYGPPNYGEDTATDEKVSAPMLVLSKAIAVCADTGTESVNGDAFSHVQKLQFVILKPGVDYNKFLNHDVVVTGSLYEGQTAHYYTDVAIEVQGVRLTDGRVFKFHREPPKPLFDSVACMAVRPTPEISRIQVGPFPLDSTVGALERLFPSFRPAKWITQREMTRFFEAGEEPHFSAAVNFMLPCVELEALLPTDSVNLQTAAQTWEIMGIGATLPRGVSLTSTWQDLRRAYGPRVTMVLATGAPTVCFDALPGFAFVLRTRTFRREWPIDSIPANAPIWGVKIAPSGGASPELCES